jgi:MFS family permease
MFAPSFVTGHLITRFGLTRIILTGAVLLLLCSLINLSGLATFNFWAANVALGVGWNFLFVGATTLLTRIYAGAERGKVQAFNDFLVFGTVTLSSFASGAMLSGAGWIMVQIAVVPAVRRGRWGGGVVVAPPRRERRCYALLSPCKQIDHDAP